MTSFYQGNSVDIDTAIVHGDTNAPYDITNCKIWFTVKNFFTDPDSAALLQVTTNTGITIISPANGLATITLLPTQTQLLPTNINLHCDVQIRTPQGKVYTVWIDTLVVNDKVTDTLDF